MLFYFKPLLKKLNYEQYYKCVIYMLNSFSEVFLNSSLSGSIEFKNFPGA